MPEKIVNECPFCKKQTIEVMHSAEVYSTQTIRVGSNRKTIPCLTQAKDQIMSEKCSNCGKTKREIQEAMKNGVPLTREERIKRLQEAGLPLRITDSKKSK